ncbi:MAG: hypothetical protein E7040_00550 [Lentisphaerae bacterium]|nr:hypothetical protein [Lentisphaerota bacterium]
MKGFNGLNLALLLFLICTGLSAQIRKDLIVTLQPITGVKDAFLLQCSAEEHSAAISTSSVLTTRLPGLPLKVGKWEESIYIMPGSPAPMKKLHLINGVTFKFPVVGISRKALLEPDPEEPGEYRLYLFWYEGKMFRFGEITSFRIWSIVSLRPGKPERIGSLEITK